MKVVQAPDFIEPIIGWRSWSYDRAGNLFSANHHALWRPGVNQAICDPPKGPGKIHEDPPKEDCTCGYYGYYDFSQINDPAVRGAFLAWGDIILHPTRFRSQFAQIACLIGSNRAVHASIDAADYYGVPILGREAAQEFVATLGRTVPQEMIPKEEIVQEEYPSAPNPVPTFAAPPAPAISPNVGLLSPTFCTITESNEIVEPDWKLGMLTKAVAAGAVIGSAAMFIAQLAQLL